jgi:hypothetical protein
MNDYTYISIFFIIFGIILLIFRKKIIEIQGPSTKKYQYSESERNRIMIIGGIGSIIFGIIFIITI